MPDIVDTAMSSGMFNTLVKAVIAAELVDIVIGPGPFTVFAPTDMHSLKFPKMTSTALKKPQLSSRMF